MAIYILANRYTILERGFRINIKMMDPERWLINTFLPIDCFLFQLLKIVETVQTLRICLVSVSSHIYYAKSLFVENDEAHEIIEIEQLQ